MITPTISQPQPQPTIYYNPPPSAPQPSAQASTILQDFTGNETFSKPELSTILGDTNPYLSGIDWDTPYKKPPVKQEPVKVEPIKREPIFDNNNSIRSIHPIPVTPPPPISLNSSTKSEKSSLLTPMNLNNRYVHAEAKPSIHNLVSPYTPIVQAEAKPSIHNLVTPSVINLVSPLNPPYVQAEAKSMEQSPYRSMELPAIDYIPQNPIIDYIPMGTPLQIGNSLHSSMHVTPKHEPSRSHLSMNDSSVVSITPPEKSKASIIDLVTPEKSKASIIDLVTPELA